LRTPVDTVINPLDWQNWWARVKDRPVTPNGSLSVSKALFIAGVLISAITVAAMMGTGKMPLAIAGALVLIVASFGAVLVRQVRLEVLVGWLMIPVILAYPPSKNQIGPLPAPNSIRMFLVAILAGLIFLNPASTEERKTSRMTKVFRTTQALLIAITGLSAFFVSGDTVGDPRADWANTVLLIVGAGLVATFFKSPRLILQTMANAARPLAIILGLIAIVEYLMGASLYGLAMRVSGLDRRAPGPFYSAEVLGYFFSILAALVLYHASRFEQSRSSKLLNNLALLFCTLGTVVTFFRSGWLSLIAVGLVYLAFHLPSLNRIRRFVQWMVVLSPAFALGIALIAVTVQDTRGTGSPIPFLDTIQERINGDSSQNSAGNRATLAESAWLMVQQYPLTGVGFGQYPTQMLRYIPNNLPAEQFEVIYKAYDVSDWQGKVAHNSYVQLVAECGIPALFLLLLTQIMPIYALFVRRRQLKGDASSYLFLAIAIFASTATSFMSQSMLYYGDAALVWTGLLLGVLIRVADPIQTWNTLELGKGTDDFWSPPPS
jgi:O-antigen ligase